MCPFFVHKYIFYVFFFFQAEDGIRDYKVTGVQTCALPISPAAVWILLTRHITDKVCTAGTTSSFGITDAVIHIRVDPVGT